MCNALKKNKEAKGLIDFAASLGFEVEMSRNGHIKFNKPGHVSVFTSSTPSDHRAWLNAKSQIKRSNSHTLAKARA